MAALFTKETITKAMEQCQWAKCDQFVLAADLKPKRLEKAIACNAPGLRKEEVVAFRDQTLLQSGKEGWILTANKIYFHEKYQLSSDPYNKKWLDFSIVKEIHHQKGSSWITLTYQDGTKDSLDCYIPNTGDRIYEFLSCIISLYNAGFCDTLSSRKDVKQMLHDRHLQRMAPIFAGYPSFVPASELPAKKTALLKKALENPFLEKIVAFHGNIEPTIAYGHLFTTQYYYFLSSGKVADRISLWTLEDIYPHHSDHEMTAIEKDGTVKPLNVGTQFQDDLEAIFEEIISRRLHNDVRGQHLKESEEEAARRTRVVRKMSLLRNRDISRPYENHLNLKELGRTLEAAGDTEELPFIYDHIGFRSYPPEDSYYYAKSYLYMPLSRISLSYVYYYLYCLKHNVRWCDQKIRRYEDLDYRAFIQMCNETPLAEVHAKLTKELESYRYLVEQ